MQSLHVKNLHASIGEKQILKGISLNVKPGEIHAIMGPNGSGKSTLAYALAGHPAYEIGEASEVLLNDNDLLPLSPDQRARLGLFLAFQHPTEVSGLSVQNFLRAMWEARFGPIAESSFKTVLEFRKHIAQVAQELKVKPELLQRNLNEGFSGGERKRLEILQLALFQPQFAVLDETDSGLDIDALKLVAEGARKVVDEQKTGVIIITHYQRILKFLQPDFVHILVGGKIVASGGNELAEELEKHGYQDYKG